MKSYENIGEMLEEDLSDMLEYFWLNSESEMLAWVDETRFAIMEPSAKKSAKRRQRRAHKAEKLPAGALQTA